MNIQDLFEKDNLADGDFKSGNFTIEISIHP
jgi:hypothetical protein